MQRQSPKPPNILLLMADQLTRFAVGAYGHPVVKTPHIDALAARGVLFQSAYCASPLCAPARFTLLAGQQASRIGAYDNAAYFASTVPTFAHYLRSLGYFTCLSGKMHFIGPDQLHGFEQRLTTDIYPADFGWTPDWTRPEQRVDWWYHNMSSVKQAGVAEITNQLEFDDETGYQARRKLYDLARGNDQRPFALAVSFTHPHDPYVTRRRYWELYREQDIDLPQSAPGYAEMDPHSRRLYQVSDMGRHAIGEQDIVNARRAYYGNVSYIDQWVGELIATLDATGLGDDTVVVLTSDHGDLLGEHGLWYKMSFFEWACQVPLIVAAPTRFPPRRIDRPVSHLDLLPTLVDIASTDRAGEPFDYADPIDGHSLLPELEGGSAPVMPDVIGQYLGEGSISPLLMLRRERHKYIHCDDDPPQLYDLAVDPGERENLASLPEYADIAATLRQALLQRYDTTEIKSAVVADQKRRRLLYSALQTGSHSAWDFQPRDDASQRFMRNHLDLNELEHDARFPRPPATD